jgi:hypothetical protein
MDVRYTVAAALLAGGGGHTLPVGYLFVGTLACEAQDAAIAHQGLNTGHANLSCFFNQPIHPVIGRHAHSQVNAACCFTFVRLVLPDHDLYLTASHAGDGGLKLASGTKDMIPARTMVKKHDAVTGLQAQHLYMASRAGW